MKNLAFLSFILLSSIYSLSLMSCSEEDTEQTNNDSQTVIETNKNYLCPDNNHPHLIDMGSNIKWSCCNVGAKKPDNLGWSFAWGETSVKFEYTQSNYKHCITDENSPYIYNFKNIGNDISVTSYDAAYVICGNGFRMPTKDEYRVLLATCTSKYTILNGVDGHIITAKNGNSIFFPTSFNYGNNGVYSIYWSSTVDINYDWLQKNAYAYCINFHVGNCATIYGIPRHNGGYIRPVRNY